MSENDLINSALTIEEMNEIAETYKRINVDTTTAKHMPLPL